MYICVFMFHRPLQYQLFCISFNDGQAKIFNSNTNKNNYPICIIKEFSPQLGVNSLYVSKFNNNIWKIDDQNNPSVTWICCFHVLSSYKSYLYLYICKMHAKPSVKSFFYDINAKCSCKDLFQPQYALLSDLKN